MKAIRRHYASPSMKVVILKHKMRLMQGTTESLSVQQGRNNEDKTEVGW